MTDHQLSPDSSSDDYSLAETSDAEMILYEGEEAPASQLSSIQTMLLIITSLVSLLTWMLPILIFIWIASILGTLALGGALSPEQAKSAWQHEPDVGDINWLQMLLLTAISTIPLLFPALALRSLFKDNGKLARILPLSALMILISAVYILLITIFYKAGGRLPDMLFARFWDTSGVATMFCLPWLLIRTLWIEGRTLWRWIISRPFWGGALWSVSSAFTMAVVTLWSVVGVGLWAIIPNHINDHAPDDIPFLNAFNRPNTATPQREPRDQSKIRFDDCFLTLYTKQETWIRYVQRQAPKLSSDAEDIVASTMLDVCVAHQRAEKKDLEPYFQTALRNHIARRVKRYRDVAFDGTYLDSLPPEINFEAIYRLNKLNSLSEEQKTILRLHLQGYSHKEIGAQLNISEENARKRSERARKAFCKEIDCPEQYCQKKDCSKD